MTEVEKDEVQTLKNIYTYNGFAVASGIDDESGEDGIEKFCKKVMGKKGTITQKLTEAKVELRKKLRFVGSEYKEGDYDKAFEALFNHLFDDLLEENKKQKKLTE